MKIYIGIFGILFVLLALGFFGLWAKDRTQNTNSYTQSPTQNSTSQKPPSKTTISTPAPIQIRTLKGEVTTLDSNNITVKNDKVSENFPLTTATDIQKLLSGTLEGGDAKTIPAKLEDVKAGQEVFLVIDNKSNTLTSLLILK